MSRDEVRTNNVATLREAAEVLRERAAKVDPSTGWSFSDGGARDDGTQPGDSALIEFITMMSPPFALAVADWLDLAADDHDAGCPTDCPATRAADDILGGER